MRWALIVVTIGLLAGASGVTNLGAQKPQRSGAEYPTPLVREEQKVSIGGVPETWQLRWTAPPTLPAGPATSR